MLISGENLRKEQKPCYALTGMQAKKVMRQLSRGWALHRPLGSRAMLVTVYIKITNSLTHYIFFHCCPVNFLLKKLPE